ncbi:globin domain-containing protein [Polyangium sp. y55x31]|uniref:globin domain-containing protein n=1 Tax=Polyangium sp. y55x31 TaxID=3042688 RepID=UPI0024832A1A|nr:globin domain-containing protein [Polyangium sp. y55x31]MDI1479732.1 FAD-binding oxidoreductase [Polyangium sp. y55x31]
MSRKTLSAETVAIVKATAPVLAEHGATIIRHFYRHLHHDHPELELLFNPANQGTDEGKTRGSQQEAFRGDFFGQEGARGAALTNVLNGSMTSLDDLPAVKATVMRIAHRHASLDVRPEHYPIIGQYFLASVKAVLGDVATDEIMAAWREAYDVLADLFIEVERDLMQKNAHTSGGWEGFRPFVVRQKVKESADAVSVYLSPKDGGPLPHYEAGQYVTFRIDVPGYARRGGSTVYRNYSLSTAPGKGYFRVTIKHEPGAKGHPDGVVSGFFHEQLREGDVLDISTPFGEFALVDSPRPLVFIGAGIGITAVFSLFQSALERGIDRPIHFFQMMRDGRHHPLRREIEALAQRHPNVTLHRCYSQPSAEDEPGRDYETRGRLGLGTLARNLPGSDCEFYFTGPIPFMRSIRGALHLFGVAADRVHYECYGPHGPEIEADVR